MFYNFFKTIIAQQQRQQLQQQQQQRMQLQLQQQQQQQMGHQQQLKHLLMNQQVKQFYYSLEYVHVKLWAATLSSHISCSCDEFFFARLLKF